MLKGKFRFIVAFVVIFGSLVLVNWGLSKGYLLVTADTAIFFSFLSTYFAAMTAFFSFLVVLEMRRDREALLRLSVYVDFEIEEGILFFIIENAGQSTAKDIVVDIDPLPYDDYGEQIGYVSWIGKTIETLLPGKKLGKNLGHVSEYGKYQKRPTKFSISVVYKSLKGKEYKEEPYLIDIDQHKYAGDTTA